MSEKNKIWSFIKEKLENNTDVILVSVLDTKGGSPGRKGFKMAVSADELAGTIGGGAMEFNIINETRDCLANGGSIREIRKLIHNKDAGKNASGLICTGRQTICIYSLTVNELSTITEICRLASADACFTLNVSAEKFEVSSQGAGGIKILSSSKNKWSYTEEITSREIIYIAGGGHVGRALARVMKTLDFKIKVLDPRPEIIAGLDFLLPDEKLPVDFNTGAGLIEDGNNIYITILTSSHLTDKEMLKLVINKNVKYIGMMGSKPKVKQIFAALSQEGIMPGLFDKVHSPIGIEINSLTPAEIAISIAAEIIKVKNGA